MRNTQYLTDPPKRWMIIFWCGFALFIAILVFCATGKDWGAFGLDIIASGGFGALYIRIYWNYPILLKDYLVIQNILHCSNKFRYNDIESATVINAGRGNLLIIKLKQKLFSRHIIISCVHDKDLDKLSADLLQKGVNTIRKKTPFN